MLMSRQNRRAALRSLTLPARRKGRCAGIGTFGQKRRRRPKSQWQVELTRQCRGFCARLFGRPVVFRGWTESKKGTGKLHSSSACRRRPWEAAAIVSGQVFKRTIVAGRAPVMRGIEPSRRRGRFHQKLWSFLWGGNGLTQRRKARQERLDCRCDARIRQTRGQGRLTAWGCPSR
jgi:hypothetical protein